MLCSFATSVELHQESTLSRPSPAEEPATLLCKREILQACSFSIEVVGLPLPVVLEQVHGLLLLGLILTQLCGP